MQELLDLQRVNKLLYEEISIEFVFNCLNNIICDRNKYCLI